MQQIRWLVLKIFRYKRLQSYRLRHSHFVIDTAGRITMEITVCDTVMAWFYGAQ